MNNQENITIQDYVWYYGIDGKRSLAKIVGLTQVVEEGDKYGEDVDEVTSDDNYVADVELLNEETDKYKWGRKNQVRLLNEYELFRYVGEENNKKTQ